MAVHISCLKWDKGLWVRALSLTEICYSLSLNHNFRLPQSLQRAMAAEAEAAREARAKVIAAEGEMKASKVNYLFHRYSKASRYTAFLFAGFKKKASDVISESGAALQLRYLQTLTHISAEKNSTIVFPLPIDMMNAFMKN